MENSIDKQAGMGKLTAKQERFCQEYVVDCNGTQAAIRAGYNENTAAQIAYENLRKPEIEGQVAGLLEQAAKAAGLSAEYVLSGLMQVHQRCMEAVEVFDREGNSMGFFQFNAAGANRALELLGKHLKLFTDKVEHGAGASLAQLMLEAAKRNPVPKG